MGKFNIDDINNISNDFLFDFSKICHHCYLYNINILNCNLFNYKKIIIKSLQP